jgi:hypothetical protein
MTILQRACRLGSRRTKIVVVAMWVMIITDLVVVEVAIVTGHFWPVVFGLVSILAGTNWLDRTRTP